MNKLGEINVFGKWNLDEAEWKGATETQFGRSFAICSYDKIVNDPNQRYDYIIMANGSRVEDHSKNGTVIKESELRVDNIIEHYKKCNGNYIIKTFFMDADAPIVEDAKLLAKYIDTLASLPTTNTINVLGLSKCGAMNFYIPQFFRDKRSFEKTNIYNIAAPYTGTKLASPLVFYPEAEKLISSKLGNNKLAEMVYNGLINIYEGVSSNSHMDYDIAIPGGIPENKSHLYDASFIENIFSGANIDAINKINCFRNLVTGIDSNTLGEAIRTMDFAGIGLCILDDLFFNNQSDGMVYVDAQRTVENFLDVKSQKLQSAHHSVNTNARVFNDILGIVDDTIDETNEKQLVLSRHQK